MQQSGCDVALGYIYHVYPSSGIFEDSTSHLFLIVTYFPAHEEISPTCMDEIRILCMWDCFCMYNKVSDLLFSHAVDSRTHLQNRFCKYKVNAMSTLLATQVRQVRAQLKLCLSFNPLRFDPTRSSSLGGNGDIEVHCWVDALNLQSLIVATATGFNSTLTSHLLIWSYC